MQATTVAMVSEVEAAAMASVTTASPPTDSVTNKAWVVCMLTAAHVTDSGTGVVAGTATNLTTTVTVRVTVTEVPQTDKRGPRKDNPTDSA